MRTIKIMLTNDVTNATVDDGNLNIYKFDKYAHDENMLKNIVININKSQNKIVCLITNKDNLFELFNRRIIIVRDNFNNGLILKDKTNNIPESELNIKHISNSEIFNLDYIFKVFKNNIKEVLFNYGNIFNLDIEKLTKGTTYKVNTKKHLWDLINEDFNLISFKQIVTSRLCIIFYRLTYFDLEASKVYIGRFFANYFEKSESFKINLNRNPNGWFFTDLNNKIFRGYVIKVKKIEQNYDEFDIKINIAKQLLSNGVSKKIVSKSLEISEECIDLFVFEIRKKKLIQTPIEKGISKINDIEFEKSLMKQVYAKPISIEKLLPKKKPIELMY